MPIDQLTLDIESPSLHTALRSLGLTTRPAGYGRKDIMRGEVVVLEAATAGRPVSDAALLELARAVLDRPDVAAALRVLQGGPATLAAGLELAAALMRGARVCVAQERRSE